GNARASLHRADQHSSDNREERWQDSAQHEHHPPGRREPAISPPQAGEKLPLLARTNRLEHRHVSNSIATKSHAGRLSSYNARQPSPNIRPRPGPAIVTDAHSAHFVKQWFDEF